mgnify:CR=1 FL=1
MTDSPLHALVVRKTGTALSNLQRERLDQAIIAPPAANARRAGYLAELGWLSIHDGRADDPATLQPLYLRRPHITQPKKAVAARE